MDSLKRKLSYLYKKFKPNRKINMKWHKVEISFLEGVFARGNRRLGKVLEAAHEMGCKFDGWTERFDFNKWMEAFNRCGVNPEFYANRNINKDEILPWGHIKTGISQKFLYKEFEASVKDILSSDCRYEGCIGCGLDPKKCLILNKSQDAGVKGQGREEDSVPKTIPQPAISSSVHSRVRIRYEKKDDMKFLSHLEVGRAFSRAFRRTGIHLQYSDGYHPHPKIAFGFALPVGIESRWEYFDAELSSNIKTDEIINKLNTELPSGLKAISAEFIPSGTRSISDITNKIIFSVSLQPSAFSLQPIEERFKNFFLQDRVIIDRIRKGGVKKIDIKPLIESIKIIGHEGEWLKIEMVFNVLNGTLLQPIEVLQNLLSPDIGTSVLLTEKIGVEMKQ
ncbi:MAG TPA: hypothetical protein DCY98_06020 [Nitrospinae bacterium]|nr:hypothetical protein [Nitrospinota bacterium]